MHASEFSVADIERIGPVIESLLKSDKLSPEEHSAVDLCGRAAADLALIRHSEVTQQFYERPDVTAQSGLSAAEWLENHPDAEPGTLTSITGRMHSGQRKIARQQHEVPKPQLSSVLMFGLFVASRSLDSLSALKESFSRCLAERTISFRRW